MIRRVPRRQQELHEVCGEAVRVQSGLLGCLQCFSEPDQLLARRVPQRAAGDAALQHLEVYRVEQEVEGGDPDRSAELFGGGRYAGSLTLVGCGDGI